MLDSKGIDRLWARSNPDHASIANGSCEVLILGQESIARNDRICFLFFGYSDDLVAFSIGGRVTSWQKDSLIGLADMK